LEDATAGFIFSQGYPHMENIFFRKGSNKIFEWIINKSRRHHGDPATALKLLAKENFRGFNTMYKKLEPLKIFQKKEGNKCMD
jgi:hypothetical protein